MMRFLCLHLDKFPRRELLANFVFQVWALVQSYIPIKIVVGAVCTYLLGGVV
jgi:hypothetical protein